MTRVAELHKLAPEEYLSAEEMLNERGRFTGSNRYRFVFEAEARDSEDQRQLCTLLLEHKADPDAFTDRTVCIFSLCCHCA